ncbi:MAG: hypothetical protein ABR908_02535 [Terriglobales bacterium]
MLAKRLAVLAVSVLVLVASATAQINQLSVTAGRTFVSTETVPSTGLPVHFANPPSVAFNYGRLLKTYKIFGLYGELPVAIIPRMNVNYNLGTNPKDIGMLFVTPSLRVNIFSADSVTPWVSVGGGYGRFRVSPVTLYENPNPGSDSNTGVVQFGAGLDVWFWHVWGARFEARDFYSGDPDLNVVTNNSRQHNYYVGVGVMHRF